MRRKRLLAKLNANYGAKDDLSFDEADEDEDFDAEAFFGVKEADLGAIPEEDEDLMLKAI
jgi:hypothetical protein